MEWDTFSINAATLAAGAQGFTEITAGFHTDVRKGLTILRMIGDLYVVGGAANSNTEWTAGIAMVAAEAAAALIFPDPASDTSFPWMWWGRGLEHRGAAGDDSFNYRRVPIDVKSRRAFRDQDDQCLFLVDNDDPADALEYTFGLRVLYGLP